MAIWKKKVSISIFFLKNFESNLHINFITKRFLIPNFCDYINLVNPILDFFMLYLYIICWIIISIKLDNSKLDKYYWSDYIFV